MNRWWVCVIFSCIFWSFSFGQDTSAQRKADSLRQQIDSLQLPGKKKIDSLKQLRKSVSSVGASAQQKVNHALDSLHPNQKLTNYQTRIDSTQRALTGRLTNVQNRLKAKSDSLKSLKLPTEKVDAQITQLQTNIDSLKLPIPSVNVKQAEERLQKLNNSVTSRVAKLEQGVGIQTKKLPTELQSKVGNVSSITNSVTQQLPANPLSGVSVPAGGLPGSLNTNAPGITTPSIPGASLPTGGGLPSANGVGALPGINAPSSSSMPSIPSANGLNTGSMPSTNLPTANLNEVTDISKQAGDLAKLPGEASQYGEQLNQLKDGEVDSAMVKKWMEENASRLKETKMLREQQQAIEKYKQMSERYRDPVAMKKELQKNAKELAFDKVAASQATVNEAVANMNKMKKAAGDVKTIDTQVKQKRVNPMHGKPFKERLLPGVSLQMQNGTNFLLDVNPYIGYHLSGRWTAGLGWNERIACNFSKGRYFISEERVYGVRSFLQFRLLGQLTLRGEIETMNSPVRQLNLPLDNGNRKWVWSYVAGIKQEFRISKHINGNAQVLYNLYDPKRESPYADRLIVRLGFEFPVSKKKTTTK
ncbi:MAG: hypothetical protein HYZ44_17365 [Bacteroidetes bacterium]|nr:hypothetical protein [Bacteroidota bacterium]